MNGSTRFAYLLQNALLVLPLLALFLVGLGITYFYPGLLWEDVMSTLGIALTVTAGALLFLMGRSVALIVFSLIRTRRRNIAATK
jgi:hypothetical protein